MAWLHQCGLVTSVNRRARKEEVYTTLKLGTQNNTCTYNCSVQTFEWKLRRTFRIQGNSMHWQYNLYWFKNSLP